MKTFWATFFVDAVAVVRKIEAPTLSEAMSMADRHAKAASRAIGRVHQVLSVQEKYPDEYVLNEAAVADLEYMARKVQGKEAPG